MDSRGPFLESPDNFWGPRPEFGIKTQRLVAGVLAHKRVHSVSLTDTSIVLLSKIINCRSWVARFSKVPITFRARSQNLELKPKD